MCGIDNIHFGSEFWSAIVGAVVGGAIAFGVQMYALQKAKIERQEERSLVKQAQAHSLLFKMIKILSTFQNLQSHFDQSFAKLEARGPDAEPWQVVQPIANLPDRVDFLAEEMAMLLSLKDDDLFNSLLSLDVRHNSTVAALATLNLQRQALTDILPAQMVGNVGNINLTQEQARVVRPKMIEVNTLIEALRAQVAEGRRDSAAVMENLNTLLRNRLSLTYSLTVEAKPIAAAKAT